MFDKHTEAECMDIFDCWIYIVKNMNMFEQMPFSEKYPVFRKLAEIGDLRKLSREELELYDEDIKNMRDIYATRKFDEKNKKRLLGGSRTYREPPIFLYHHPYIFPKNQGHLHKPVFRHRC